MNNSQSILENFGGRSSFTFI